MTSLPSTGLNDHPKGPWFYMSPYVVPPLAASAAIVPVFRDMVFKSAQQKGNPVPNMSFLTGFKEGIKAAPTVGAIVGTQLIIQRAIEKVLSGESNTKSMSSALASSAIVGIVSAPVLAVFNGQTMGWTVRESLRKFTVMQGMAIAVQETAFVGGLSVADQLAVMMREVFGNNKVVDYTAAFSAGAAGSLAGHPANTALTRWQSGLAVDSFPQLMWGARRKAWAVGIFSVVYKLGKETLNSTFPSS